MSSKSIALALARANLFGHRRVFADLIIELLVHAHDDGVRALEVIEGCLETLAETGGFMLGKAAITD